MNQSRKIIFAALFAVVFSSVVAVDEGRGRGNNEQIGSVTNKVYIKECGACHLAFQPQLLPKRSWEKIMGTLDKHFGDSATLDEAAAAEILAYLVKYSAETSSSEESIKILASLGKSETPLRISDTPYFKRKHRKLNADVFKRKSIGSPANCSGCHLTAEKGDYDEDNVKIPKK